MRKLSFAARFRAFERGRFAGFSALLAMLAAVTLHAQQPAAATLPDGDGKDLFATACSQCHSIQVPMRLRDGKAGWKMTVERMTARGAQLNAEEAATVINYLSVHFGPGVNPMQTRPLPNTASAQTASAGSNGAISLPAGDGRDVVESRCTVCHDLGRVVGAKRSKSEWEFIVNNMNARGPQGTPEQVRTIIAYLTAKFGE